MGSGSVLGGHMRRRSRFLTAFALAGCGFMVVPPLSAGDEVAQLRRELEALRQEYGSRMAAIESRIAALEEGHAAEATPAAAASVETPAPAPPATAAVPPATAGEGSPSALPVYGGAASASKVFNP